MNQISSSKKLPPFLESYIEFRQHIETFYGDFSSNVEKGKEFAKLVKDTLSSREDFLGLVPRTNPKQSHDGGVDIFWISPEDNQERIFCESKFSINKVDIL